MDAIASGILVSYRDSPFMPLPRPSILLLYCPDRKGLVAARGVKLIGSTSHYVTEVLDDGPIIAQDVMSISHEDRPPDLIQKGRTWSAWCSPARCAGIWSTASSLMRTRR